MSESTENLVLEILRGMRSDLTDVKEDIRGVKKELVSIRTIMGEMFKSEARQDEDIATLKHRIERIEHRLDLRDIPSA